MRCKKGSLATFAWLTVCAVALGACGDNRIGRAFESILPDPGEYVYGAVVADDSAAVVAAQEIIAKGGTAADAAVALYFTMAVTMPSVASIGGGGVCMVHNPRTGKTEMLDFIGSVPASGLASGDRPSAVPGNIRGMAALHGKLGRLPWSTLLEKAETLARQGHIVSKRTAQDLARAAGPLFADAPARRVFATGAGDPVAQGYPIRQVELGAALGQIRARGAGAFYTGSLGDRFIHGVRQAGGTLTKKDLREYTPYWRPAVSVPFGGDVFHTVGHPVLAGMVAAQMWRMLVTDDRYAKTPAEERPHLLAEVARRALAGRSEWISANGSASKRVERWLSPEQARRLMSDYRPSQAGTETGRAPRDFNENRSGSGFVVVDGAGMTVACTVTLYNPFGTGRLVPGIGAFLAQAPGLGSRNPFALAPVIVTDSRGRLFRFAVAGTGGETLASAIVNVAARTILDKEPLKDAIASGRIHWASAENAVAVEPSETAPRIGTLIGRGHNVRRRRDLGRLNAIHCPTGLPTPSPRKVRCSPEADNRGEGFGATFLIELE